MEIHPHIQPDQSVFLPLCAAIVIWSNAQRDIGKCSTSHNPLIVCSIDFQCNAAQFVASHRISRFSWLDNYARGWVVIK